jgi:hypothetical protein
MIPPLWVTGAKTRNQMAQKKQHCRATRTNADAAHDREVNALLRVLQVKSQAPSTTSQPQVEMLHSTQSHKRLRAFPSTGSRPQIEMICVAISGWKKFNVSRFAVQPTYMGFLEGTVSGINYMLQRKLARVVAASLALDHFAHPPLYIPEIDLGRVLPVFLCMALLEAASFSKEDEWGGYSMCGVCWFVDDLTPSIAELISNGVKRFDWKKFAINASI